MSGDYSIDMNRKLHSKFNANKQGYCTTAHFLNIPNVRWILILNNISFSCSVAKHCSKVCHCNQKIFKGVKADDICTFQNILALDCDKSKSATLQKFKN